jgi:hypothetical protein
MSMPTRPSDPRLLRIVAALEEVPPTPLAGYPWAHSAPGKHRGWVRPIYLALALTAGAAACAAAIVASGGASTGATPSLSAATRAAFSVFDEPGVRPSPIAIKVTRELTSRHVHGVIDQASYRVAQSSASFELIVFGNSMEVCLVEREPGLAAGGGCGPEPRAASAAALECGTIEAPERNGGVLLDCLVPNGVSNVSVGTPAQTVPLSVIKNTVAAILDPKPTSVSWTTPDGTRREEQLIQ